MPARKIAHPSLEERRARGKVARTGTPLSAHAGWEAASDRPDPVALLEEQNTTREQDLVPVRHGRMMVSPFTFYRGAARIMATDLTGTPRAGLDVQLCGDAHLSNFGGYGSPERRLLFDVNDFDETLPGPFEYDVKRMAASFTIAGRNNGFNTADARAVTRASVTGISRGDGRLRADATMEVWYAHLAEDDIMASIRKDAKTKQGAKEVKRAEKVAKKARTRDSLQALSKLAERVDGTYRIVSRPPLVVPLRELATSHGVSPEEVETRPRAVPRLPPDPPGRPAAAARPVRGAVDIARKVVGVGSVGTWAFIVLLQGRDDQDPLFLQVKQATASVLEDHLPRAGTSSTASASCRASG